ncbi:hypothetical protein KIL84_015625 [Mauremys mutica]|uniref:Uncharacterized protein n=1 Tax=Mauremys mutica TaxID=74926 RepID=A0A9D4APW1_9SAUR|nr:hypothetical protein KIL84_015625 [Mauremys mutica]
MEQLEGGDQGDYISELPISAHIMHCPAHYASGPTALPPRGTGPKWVLFTPTYHQKPCICLLLACTRHLPLRKGSMKMFLKSVSKGSYGDTSKLKAHGTQ